MRRAINSVWVIVVLASVLMACQPPQPEVFQKFNTPTDKLITGGQPSADELEMIKKAGVKAVINLRGPDETLPFDEETEAERIGLQYVSLPISGADDVTRENAKVLHGLLQGDEKVFVHCASGNRVGALLAIAAHEFDGKAVEASLELGREAGLGSLEERVKAVLGKERSGGAQ